MKKPRSTRFPLTLAQAGASLWIGLAAAVILLLIFNLIFSLSFGNRIYPGVSFSGISLSGLQLDEAATLISDTNNYPQSGRIILTFEDRQWVVTPAQLGVEMDSSASAVSALNAGREGSIDQIMLDRFTLLRGELEIQPSFTYNELDTVNYLNTIAAQINQPLQEAYIELSGTEVVVHDSQPGRALDVPASLKLIAESIELMQDAVIPLTVVTTDPLVQDVSAQRALAETILSQPLRLNMPPEINATENDWQIEPATLARLLSFDRVQNGSQTTYEVSINPVLARLHLDSIRSKLDAAPQNARFIFNDETGVLDLKDAAVVGRSLNIPQTIDNLNESIKAGSHDALLSFEIAQPAVTDDKTGADLGITELVYQYTTYFYGSSPDRVQNIKAAASSFHGLLVAPGAILSMSDELGDISLDNGYAEALIIYGGETIKGVGGGVCQVSTTLFRTAYFGGFPIIERHPHSYRVGYYEQTSSGSHNPKLAGLDATVFVPLVDFKFKNDTEYWLLMETYVTNDSALTWKFYSTSDGRTVEHNTTGPTDIVEAPEDLYRENPELPKGVIKQVDWAAEGAKVVVSRIVRRGGEVLFSDSFTTIYEPWRNIFEFGPGTENMPPEKSKDNADD